ncbi:MAG: hypothetical protein RL701_1182 [Pseudomonadota bacterium]|jgi:hypothetical protein
MAIIKKQRRLFRWALLLPTVYVLAVNMSVRHFGGDANPLAITRMAEKSSALARLGLHSLRHVWSNACDDTAPYVREAAKAEGIPVSFALAIARNESGFRSHVISSTGAMGVMQLMPATASRHGVWDPFDPEDNARGGARYLSALWKRYRGDRMRVAAAYNAGEGAVPRAGRMRVPGSTLSYAASVVRHDSLLGPRASEGGHDRSNGKRLPIQLIEPVVITANRR